MVSHPHSESGHDDRALITAFLADRSQGAFRRLYGRHARRLYGLLVRLTGRPSADVDELYQECWVRIVEALPGFAWRSSFAAWSGGIALNCVREWRRGNARRPEPADEELADPRAGAAAVEEALDLDDALARLPNGYREILVLHDVCGHTHAEIAELLAISVGTSKSQLFHARRAVRRFLSPEEQHE